MTDAAAFTAADDRRGLSEQEAGPASRQVVVAYGFWIFLLSDIVMFSAMFAAHAVLVGETAGGPSGKDLFDLPYVFVETALLLTSSFTCGMMGVAVWNRSRLATYAAAAITFALGAAFVAMEVAEFVRMIGDGAGPSRSAFLSAFFLLVGTHGLHVSVGLVWLTVMMAQVATLGFRANVVRRLFCFSLYWHALDIIWVALFTTVYLMGLR